MSEHKFLTQNHQKANLPEHLKHCQHNHTDGHRINSLHFYGKIQVDMFPDLPDNGPVILAITDENTAYSVPVTYHRFNRFRLPWEIHLKEGQVKVSQLT